MRLFDAAALVALLRDEPAADEVAALLNDAAEQRVISAVNLAEVFDDLVRVRGHSREVAADRVLHLRLGGLDVLFVDDLTAEEAGALRARHYHHRTSALSLADCAALATARRERASLATSDGPLARAARAEGVEVIGLPDSTGSRP